MGRSPSTDYERLTELYNSGVLCKSIATELGISERNVCKIARKLNLPRRTKHGIPLMHFTVYLSRDLAAKVQRHCAVSKVPRNTYIRKLLEKDLAQ